MNKWDIGFSNTKLFEVQSIFGRGFLQGCKNCNSIVPLNNMFQERQYIGNVYQSLCNCDKCNNFVIFDENKISLYKFWK